LAHPEHVILFDVPGSPSKLNPQTAGEFLAKLCSSGNVAASADSAALGVATVYHWLELGRQRNSGPYREFLEAYTRARGDYRLLRATRHHEIAMGGVEKKPATVEGTNIIKRDENGEVVWQEQWREPNLKALEWEMQRDEPETYGRRPEAAPQADVSESPKSRAEMQAEAAQMFDLFSGAVKILVDLGVPPSQLGLKLLEPPAVETTSKPVGPVPCDDCCSERAQTARAGVTGNTTSDDNKADR
jgi:hypothetical protein